MEVLGQRLSSSSLLIHIRIQISYKYYQITLSAASQHRVSPSSTTAESFHLPKTCREILWWVKTIPKMLHYHEGWQWMNSTAKHNFLCFCSPGLLPFPPWLLLLPRWLSPASTEHQIISFLRQQLDSWWSRIHLLTAARGFFLFSPSRSEFLGRCWFHAHVVMEHLKWIR